MLDIEYKTSPNTLLKVSLKVSKIKYIISNITTKSTIINKINERVSQPCLEYNYIANRFY